MILLPNSFKDERGLTRGKASQESLAANGLVGRICLSTDMTELQIFDEIRSIFRSPMNEDMEFSIRILRMSGGGSKTLTIPVVSSTYKWTASAVAGKNAKCPIYILADDPLKVCLLYAKALLHVSYNDLSIASSSPYWVWGGEIEQEDFPTFTYAQEKEGVNNENTMRCSISVIIRADMDCYLLF